MRELKYEFLSHSDLEMMRSEPTKKPSHSAFKAILNEPDVLTLTKSINHTSTLFVRLFTRCKKEGEEVIKLIEAETKSSK